MIEVKTKTIKRTKPRFLSKNTRKLKTADVSNSQVKNLKKSKAYEEDDDDDTFQGSEERDAALKGQ